MSAVNHQNNFATNLSSNQIAGVTTTPLNSIPSVDAPFYLAFDATNVNSKYEAVLCTSKTATNVNHAATSNAHTTAEEVRMIIPASEMDTLGSPPQGFLLNGKISPTVASNNLTVAIKTLAGTDPSPSDPVWVRIGDTVRTITAALSVTKAAGTNWCNAGSAELATKEIDYFVYLGYNATDGVVLGFSRIVANSYGEFSATTTNEKYCAISTITNAASTDYYEVVGRFAATLSAGAGYTWTVPTYTAINLIQRPIYETRLLDWVPTTSASTGTYTTTSLSYAKYRIVGSRVKIDLSITGTTSSTPQAIKSSYPFTPAVESFGSGYTTDATATVSEMVLSSSAILSYLSGFGNYTAGTGRVLRCSGEYEI